MEPSTYDQQTENIRFPFCLIVQEPKDLNGIKTITTFKLKFSIEFSFYGSQCEVHSLNLVSFDWGVHKAAVRFLRQMGLKFKLWIKKMDSWMWR